MGRFGVRRIAAVLAVLAVVAVACGDDDAATDPVAGGDAIGNAAADCMAFDEAVLLAQELAFDGTLRSASADGEQVTFEVHEWFKGGTTGEITLAAGGLLWEDAQAIIGTSLEVGQRYLISSSDGVVWACGYSVTYDTAIAAEWAALFAE